MENIYKVGHYCYCGVNADQKQFVLYAVLQNQINSAAFTLVSQNDTSNDTNCTMHQMMDRVI